jgi:RNA polymerase sigma-70 factor (ECF subfamily)
MTDAASEGLVRQHLAQWYREHRQGLYTLALAITRCPARAEDAVQEAFARLWTSDGKPGDPVPYVYAAVRHAAIDQARRAAAAARAEAASIYNGFPADPAATVAAAEQVRRLRDAVDALPDDERQVVVLRIYGGLTFEQAAEALGEPLPTVASRYRRALERLDRAIQMQEHAIL